MLLVSAVWCIKPSGRPPAKGSYWKWEKNTNQQKKSKLEEKKLKTDNASQNNGFTHFMRETLFWRDRDRKRKNPQYVQKYKPPSPASREALVLRHAPPCPSGGGVDARLPCRTQIFNDHIPLFHASTPSHHESQILIKSTRVSVVTKKKR